jgi:uncharacterized protein (TIGR03437 family)
MRNARTAIVFSFSCLLAGPVLAQTITGGSCNASNLSGTYSLTLSGRAISLAGSFAGSLQGNGTATFDGVSNVTMTGTVNTNLASGKTFTYSGTYTVPSNCYGTITLTTGSTATFALVVWSSGSQYDITGSDATYVYSGSGSNIQPQGGCATATLSGAYTYDASGPTLQGTAENGADDESGVLQFDGLGNVTASYTITSSGIASAAITSTGTYSVTSGCLATATLTDSTNKTNTLNLTVMGAYGQNANLIEANSQFIRDGQAHSAFLNPMQSIGNVASYAVGGTPPGSVFALYGINLATKTATAANVPLPDTLATTTVKVNGVTVPLFSVNSGQIDAQMPWEVQGGTIASVVVTNGSTTSNAAAIYVPAGATPGISFYSTNRAVVVDASQGSSINSASSPAAVGDVVVVYFTGGGPVQLPASAKLTTGAYPTGSWPAAGTSSITIGTVPVTQINYIGLSTGGVGLYQTNFVIPQIAKGTYPLVITIGGQANTVGAGISQPVLTISN